MGPWEDDSFLNISTNKDVNHCTLYCNPSCQHQGFWTDAEERLKSDSLLPPAGIVVGCRHEDICCELGSSEGPWPPSQIKAAARIRPRTKTLWRRNRLVVLLWFFAVTVLLSSPPWIIFRCPLLLFHFTLTCRLRKMYFPSPFPQWQIFTSFVEKRKTQAWRGKRLAQGKVWTRILVHRAWMNRLLSD